MAASSSAAQPQAAACVSYACRNFEEELLEVGRLAPRVAAAVETVERGLSDPEPTAALLKDCVIKITELQGFPHLTSLQRRKLEQKLDEMKMLQQQLHRASLKMEKMARARLQREQLLGSNCHAAQRPGEEDTGIAQLAKEEVALRHTRNKVRAMADESAAVLSALRSQRRTLQHTHGRLGAFMESLGMSSQTLGQIARMNRADALLVYGGVAALALLMLFLWLR